MVYFFRQSWEILPKECNALVGILPGIVEGVQSRDGVVENLPSQMASVVGNEVEAGKI